MSEGVYENIFSDYGDESASDSQPNDRWIESSADPHEHKAIFHFKFRFNAISFTFYIALVYVTVHRSLTFSLAPMLIEETV